MTEPSGHETTTDARGYFRLYVPLQTRAEALTFAARLSVAHPGYRTVEHRYLELWSEGDWNGDGRFNSTDFVVAFTDGGYEAGPRNAVAAVPEPGSLMLVLLGLLGVVARYRRG